MTERFIKILPTDETSYLASKHPNAFILLYFIAKRARRENGHPDGLCIGQCHIGDHKTYGLTEKEYRTAKKVLIERNHIKIIETCRTRKNTRKPTKIFNDKNGATERATETTTIGTLVELCNSMVYDINPEVENQPKGDRNGDKKFFEGRPKGDEQERIRKDISNDISQKEATRFDDAHTASPIRAKDFLIFNFEKMEFEGISEKDKAEWRLMYPHIDMNVETLKAAQWLRNHPARSKKKNWRKYLTGWFNRANDTIENKKAYRSSASGSSGYDRRTKDVNGNPVESPHTGRF